jgi:arylsulfatase A-like enzyme/Flp pilus assembly protein TadD
MIATVALAGLISAGCGAPPAGDEEAAGAAGVAAGETAALAGSLTGHNLLLITLDTLRADRLGVYGYERAETPHIDRLAAEGVRFERVTTTVPVTLPAHASIMTGRLPFEHGVRNNGAFLLGEDAVTLAEALRDAGYATGGFIGAVVLDAQFGIAQGFEHYDGLAPYQARTGDLSGERPGEAVIEPASAWIREQSARHGTAVVNPPMRRAPASPAASGRAGRSQEAAAPWFAWLHLYDPHDPYTPPEPYATRHAGEPYDGEVAYVDAMIGRLRSVLEEVGVADDTLIVVTADHGEGLGDHGEQGHSLFVYDSTVRVPLILWAADGLRPGTVVRGNASVIDAMPTVLALLGVDAGAATAAGPPKGADLSGAIAPPGVTGTLRTGRDDVGTSATRDTPNLAGTPAYAESLVPYLDFGWSELRALVDGRYKYIAAPEPELYDLIADPGETNNLVDVEVARADALAARLADWVASDDVTAATGAAVDPADVAALQALGYLAGGGGAVRDRRDVDPKDMIATYERFVAGLLDTGDAIEEARYGDANEILVRLDELLPDQYIVYYYFGRLALEAGDPPTAVGALEHALELNPSYLPTYTQLANALYASGDAGAALALVDQGRAMFPGNFSLTMLEGAIAHDGGGLDEALAAYRAAETLQPDNPRLLERMGHLHLLRQQPQEAVRYMRRLVEITPDSAAAWAQLAIGLAQSGAAQEAQSAFDRAFQLDPNDPLVQQIGAQLRDP